MLTNFVWFYIYLKFIIFALKIYHLVADGAIFYKTTGGVNHFPMSDNWLSIGSDSIFQGISGDAKVRIFKGSYSNNIEDIQKHFMGPSPV